MFVGNRNSNRQKTTFYSGLFRVHFVAKRPWLGCWAAGLPKVTAKGQCMCVGGGAHKQQE